MQKVIRKQTNIHEIFDYIDSLYYETSGYKTERTLIPKYFPSSMHDILELFDTYGYEFNIKLKDMSFNKIEFNFDNKSVIVCVSGGKDSLSTALYYKDRGYDVILYHMKGINKCYPDEYKRVEDIANYLGVKVYFDDVSLSGNHMYIEHPLKNYMLMNGAIQYGISIGVSNIAVGNFTNSNLKDNKFEISGGDCIELWEAYTQILKDIIPNFHILMPLNNVNESMERLLQDKHLLSLSQSCLGTFRFREHKRKINMEKYSVDLFPNRCGSCWKCAVEYIYYTDRGLLDLNVDYYKHCLEVLMMDMKHNDLMPYTIEFIWDNYLFYPITESKIYEELKNAIVQARKIKYSTDETTREVPSTTVLSDKQ